MSSSRVSRQPSFVMLEQTESEGTSSLESGVDPRLPASRSMDLNSTKSSHLDLTPSGEVQMRVKTSVSRRETSRDIDNLQNTNTENLNLQKREKLKRELSELRETERRIIGLLESHNDDEIRFENFRLSHEGGDNHLNDGVLPDLRGQSDQCYGPSTNSSWKAPPTLRDEVCGPVRMDRNGCVDTMTPPDRRYTNVGCGKREMENSRVKLTKTDDSYSCNQLVSNGSSSLSQFKPKKPPTFDGSNSWQDFLVQFEMVSTVNRWDEYTKAYELATSLRGVAQGVVTEIEPAKRFDYDYLVLALTSRFEPVNQQNMYKAQMNSLYRKPGQALPEMAQEIRRITRLAYPSAPIDIRNQLAKDCFIRAINDSKLQLSIFQREPKSIDDCVRFGVEYESFIVDQKRLQSGKQGLRMINANDQNEDEIHVRLAKISDQIEKLNNQSHKISKVITCFYCGNKGHIKKECRKFEWDKKHNCVKYKQADKQNTNPPQQTQMVESNSTRHQGN